MTGDSVDPFPDFKKVLDNKFPPGVTATINGPNPDNPFPLSSPRALSALKFIGSLPLPEKTGSVRQLIANHGQAALRPTLNTRRRQTLT